MKYYLSPVTEWSSSFPQPLMRVYGDASKPDDPGEQHAPSRSKEL